MSLYSLLTTFLDGTTLHFGITAIVMSYKKVIRLANPLIYLNWTIILLKNDLLQSEGKISWIILLHFIYFTCLSTYLSCFKAYSNIFILRIKSCLRFSCPFLSPCRKAILAWKKEEYSIHSTSTFYTSYLYFIHLFASWMKW